MSVKHEKGTVHLITKPMAPPWTDSARNLPHYIIDNSPDTQFKVITPSTAPYNAHHVTSEPVYSYEHGLQPPFSERLKLLRYLFKQFKSSTKSIPDAELFHFFFTPNFLTSTSISLLKSITRPGHTIQTVTSLPIRPSKIRHLLFSDSVVTVSKYAESIVRKQFKGHLETIYPGIPTPKASEPEVLNQLRSKLKLEDSKILLYPGDLYFSGCRQLLPKILCRCLKEHPEIKLLVASRAKHPKDQALRIELQTITDRMVVLPENEHPIFDLISISDIVIFPVTSLYGKMDIPMVLLEAMALQKPVVASALTSLNELGQDNAAFMCDPQQPAEFVRAICRLLENEGYRSQLSQNGYNLFNKQFTAKLMAEKYQELYRKFLEGIE